MTPEAWKDIPHTDYCVSDLGRVASRKHGKWRIIKPWRTSTGYLSVNMTHVGSPIRKYRVHCLVALAFFGQKPETSCQVNHKNGVKTDNRASNLEWATPKENSVHSVRVLGRTNRRVGEQNASALLTGADVSAIRAMRGTGLTYRALAREHSVSPKTIASIVRRETWAHVP